MVTNQTTQTDKSSHSGDESVRITARSLLTQELQPAFEAGQEHHRNPFTRRPKMYGVQYSAWVAGYTYPDAKFSLWLVWEHCPWDGRHREEDREWMALAS